MSYETVMDADFDEMSEVQRQILEVSDADEQVLTFTIGDDKFCVDIDPVSEVLWNEHTLAQVPNMPDYITGVANLRGRTVGIIDPKQVLGREAEAEAENIVLFESDVSDTDGCGHAWLVDSVHQVLNISNDEIDDSVADEEMRGIIERDEELIVWVRHDCFSEDLTDLDVTGVELADGTA